MITLLKSKGYKPTKKETLQNREFRQVSVDYVFSEEKSTMASPVYDKVETIELFLTERYFKESLIIGLLEETRASHLNVSASVEEIENGRLITFTVEGR